MLVMINFLCTLNVNYVLIARFVISLQLDRVSLTTVQTCAISKFDLFINY